MANRFNMDDYIDVAARIQQFYETYPEGSLVTLRYEMVEVDGKNYVMVEAMASRTPDDPLPTRGYAWEPVPGPTPYTKDSELQNAETSAWGRAIVALGFETKHIASANEVRNRRGDAPQNSQDNDTAPEQAKPAYHLDYNKMKAQAKAAGVKGAQIAELVGYEIEGSNLDRESAQFCRKVAEWWKNEDGLDETSDIIPILIDRAGKIPQEEAA